MTNNSFLQTDYTKFQRAKQCVMALNTEYLIPKNEPVRLLDQVLEELDYTALYLTYSEKGRNPAVDPVTLFKIVVYAFSQNTFSTRKIEEACRYDVRYRYLLQWQKVPDHNTISRFIREHLSTCLEDLFFQMIQFLMEQEEIRFEQIFLDGTKIEANANKYTFVWRGSIEKNYARLKEKAAAVLQEEQEIDAAVLKRALRKLDREIEREQITFVHGAGSRKHPLQRQYEQLQEWYDRALYYEKALQILGEGRNSYSKTDPDATFMHMKDDYMRNSQLKPGYNVQVASAGEYIVGVLIHADRTDHYALIPMIELLKERFPQEQILRLVADAGYESEEGYAYLKKNRIRAFIKPSNHEYSKTKKFQQDMAFRLAMTYDKTQDVYTCKNGRTLQFCNVRKRISPSGYVSESKVYECEDCSGCPYLGECYKGKYAKKIQVAETFDAYRAESESNICSEEGILLRINRSIQAEGVFGITKQDMGHDRFLRRGKQGVMTEYLLLAFGFNINKLHHRIQEGRLGQQLLIPEKTVQTA